MHSQPRMYFDDTSITYASNDIEKIEWCVDIDLDRIRIGYNGAAVMSSPMWVEFLGFLEEVQRESKFFWKQLVEMQTMVFWSS